MTSYVNGNITTTNYESTTAYEDKCMQNNNLFTIAFMPFKVLVMFMNFILFAAAAKDREKLKRQNYTFYCVMSTLLSNTVYLMMSIWLTVDNYPQVEMDPQTDIMSTEKYIWIFSEAVTTCMVLGICANVTSLIYVTLDSVLYVGRSGTEWGNTVNTKDNARKHKIRMTQVLVAASWVIPFVLTSLTFGWNCAKECRCPSNNFQGEHCPTGRRCSHMWAPMKIDFLFIVFGIWTLEVIGLVIFVFNGIKHHNRSVQLPSKGGSDSKTDEGSCEISGDVKFAIPTQNEDRSKDQRKQSGIHGRRKSILKRKFNSRLKLATSLTILLVVCTTPATICTIVDSLMESPPYTILVIISGMFMFFYCILCPILMWRYLPSLRLSTLKLKVTLSKCSCISSRDDKRTNTESKPKV